MNNKSLYELERYYDRKQKVLEKLGNKCNICGSIKNLQVDHVDPDSKKFDISCIWSYSWSLIEKELEKCQLLCYPCHINKSQNEGSLQQFGEDNGNNKLTKNQVKDIRKQYSQTDKSTRDLATKYNVSKTCIANIVFYRTWNF